MKCILENKKGETCGEEINYNKETKLATNISDGKKHFCSNRKDQNKDLVTAGIITRLDELEKLTKIHDDVIRAHTKQLDFKKGTEV